VTIIPWRRLREIFRVMRHPAILGMVVDWGYRRDDVPVRLFGDWTTLPAGPATLAARTGAVVLPVLARRRHDGHYEPVMYEPIEVGGTSASHIAAATAAIAAALEAMVSEAPEQWYTFKPMWPATAAQAADLAARAARTEVLEAGAPDA
jgi:KDO2-lipid IV(A) lauroyltransferase